MNTESTTNLIAYGAFPTSATGQIDSKTPADAHPPLLQVTQLVRHYPLPRTHLFQPPQQVQALQGVDFTVAAGHSVGIVGESGSGKSTLARLVMALDTPTSGAVHLLRRLKKVRARQRVVAHQLRHLQQRWMGIGGFC